MAPDVTLQEGRTVRLAAAGRVGTAEALILQPGAALEALRPGSELSVDFNGALLRVVEAGPAGVTALVLEGGQVRSNKAVTVDPAPALPSPDRQGRRGHRDRVVARGAAVRAVVRQPRRGRRHGPRAA
jgi:pyruvate kinase